jgi:hypothetical protein
MFGLQSIVRGLQVLVAGDELRKLTKIDTVQRAGLSLLGIEAGLGSSAAQLAERIIDNGHWPGTKVCGDREYLAALLALDSVARVNPPNPQFCVAVRAVNFHAGDGRLSPRWRIGQLFDRGVTNRRAGLVDRKTVAGCVHGRMGS